jgi:hypothetical protein
MSISTVRASASAKKGIGLSTHDANWAQKVSEANVSWVYTWGHDLPADLPKGVEFVPMVWNDRNIDNLVIPAGSKELLGFNEPDMGDQAHMTVDAAVADWPTLEKTGLTLGSPSPAWWSTQWMKDFMGQADAKNLRVDFVCVHWYNVPDPKFFLKTIDDIHDAYHRPIWITEFAVGLFTKNPPTYTPQQVADFMRVVIPELEKRDYVQRYAWFPSNPNSKRLGASALFNADGSLTDLGKLYASY